MINFIFYTLMVLFITVCLFMVLLVLIQKGRGGGLASAFGGGGGNTAFGSKTGDVLTWATSIVFGIFLVLAISLNLMANYRHGQAVGPARPEIPATGATDSPVNLPLESTTRPATRPAGAATVPAATAPTTQR